MRALVQMHARSGVSLKAFAAAAGVPSATLAWWRARFRGDADVVLVPVVVAKDELTGNRSAVGDVVLRVPGGTSADATARLVRELASLRLRRNHAGSESTRSQGRLSFAQHESRRSCLLRRAHHLCHGRCQHLVVPSAFSGIAVPW